MRQAGLIPNEADAQRFCAYLLTLGIRSQVDADGSVWAIWIRDEDHLNRAKAELEAFIAVPHDQKYSGVEDAASSLRREEQRRLEERRRNIIDIRSNMGRGRSRRAPFVMVLMGLCALVFVTTDMGFSDGGVLELLFFCKVTAKTSAHVSAREGFSQILHGEIWRLVTPIFIHFGLMHFLFNMQALYVLGAMIEERRGTIRLAMIVFSIAIVSNLLQFSWGLIPPPHESVPRFGGISGVVFGLFGYIWMKSKYDPSSGFFLPATTTFITMLFFALCVVSAMPALSTMFGGLLPHVANTAHTVGLVMGAAYGYFGSVGRFKSS